MSSFVYIETVPMVTARYL